MRLFVPLVESGTETAVGILQLARHGLERSGDRHQGDPAYLEFMQTGETVDGGVTVFIPYGLPSLQIAVCPVGGGSELGKAKRHGGRSIEKPTAVYGPQIGIDIPAEIPVRYAAATAKTVIPARTTANVLFFIILDFSFKDNRACNEVFHNCFTQVGGYRVVTRQMNRPRARWHGWPPGN